MAAPLKDLDRNVIPRWRTSTLTAGTQELASLQAPPDGREISVDTLDQLVSAWTVNQTPSFAADLVGAALVTGHPNAAREAAEFLLRFEDPRLVVAQDLSRFVLGGGAPRARSHEAMQSTLRVQIHDSKASLAVEPRNPLSWVDLARFYTTVAQQAQATRAMRVALALAPDNRFVLRSAVRFYLHIGDADQALQLLRTSSRTPYDPWLLASEVASAAIAHKNSRFLKRGRELADSRSVAPVHTSELASALATLELEAGNTRGARKLFEKALRAPNENTLAQVEWAARRMHAVIALDAKQVSASFEASAWNHLGNGHWERSVAAAKGWLYDEPFASRPAAFGSYAATVMEDFKTSEWFAEQGLRASPGDPLLLNNLAFARASVGDIAGARKAFDTVPQGPLTPEMKLVRLATSGLLAFREGAADSGRALYDSALSLAQGPAFRGYRAMALLYYAREESRFDVTHASRLVAAASVELRQLQEPSSAALRRTRESVERAIQNAPVQAQSFTIPGADSK